MTKNMDGDAVILLSANTVTNGYVFMYNLAMPARMTYIKAAVIKYLDETK